MRRWARITLLLVVAALVLMVAAGLALRSMVNGAGKDRVIAALSERLGVPVSVAAVKLDIKQLLLFRPAIALRDVSIGNPPGFRGKNLLEAREVSAQVSLRPLLHKRIQVESIRIQEPHISVETNGGGQSNIEAVLKNASSGSGKQPSNAPQGSSASSTMLAIEELVVKSGTLALAAPENLNVHDIDIKVSGFSNDRSCKIEASAKPFGSDSTFKLDGRAGPFSADSLPLDGKLAVSIMAAEIPAAMRRERFGNLLMTPGAKARVAIEGSVRGDAYGTIAGPVKVDVSSLQIGAHPDHLLPLSGSAPATIAAKNLVGDLQFQLAIASARMQLGKGEWAGSAAFSRQGAMMIAASRGSIRNLDINQLLSAFTTSSGRVYGLLAIPSYSLEMSGKNADALRNSLRGAGKLSVTQGRLAMLDLPATLQRVVGQQQATAAAKGATSFDSLTSDLNIVNREIHVANLALTGSALELTGNGTIGFDQAIHFDIAAKVAGGLARLVNTGPFHLPSPNATIPLTVTGTVESPQVRPQVGKLAKSAAEDLLHTFLKKRLK